MAVARERLHSALGLVVMALSAVPRYRHHAFADLQSLVLEPLIRNRLAIVHVKPSVGADPSTSQLSGLAFWASVSDAVDAKICEQIKAGAFPVRLGAEDWTSGDTVWLLDVVAPTPREVSLVVANLKQVLGSQKEVRIHPMVARQLDPELLKKLGGAVAQTAG